MLPLWGGGIANTASGAGATVGGGAGNSARANHTTVGGGIGNSANNVASIIGGGASNNANGNYSTVSGGQFNTTSGVLSTVSGGNGNSATGSTSSIGGGSSNTASGSVSTVPGGRDNTAAGNYSFAAGRRAKANHAGAFIWGDSSDFDIASTIADELTARATGGVRFITAIDGTGAATKTLSIDTSGNLSAAGTLTSVAGDITATSGDIIASNGYIQLDVETTTPPSADCDAAAEVGRMKVDDNTKTLYVCVDDAGTIGWGTVSVT